MKLLSLIQAVIKLLLLLVEYLESSKVKRSEKEYQSRVKEIKQDPVAYANRKFSGVPESAGKETVYRDEA